MEGIKQWKIKEGTTIIISKATPQLKKALNILEGQNKFLY
ncbi:hypothetical protein GAPWKB11_1598 [Gilliamella apicola]|nr:hypothetical protein GAPWKB11_1598 [Gilliamella apicola]